MSVISIYQGMWNEHDKTKLVLKRIMNPLSGRGETGSIHVPAEAEGKQQRPPGQLSLWQWIALVSGPASFAVLALFYRPEGMSDMSASVLGVTAWMAIWWISECVPLPVTGFVPILVFPLTGAMSASDTFSAYGNNIIFLFLGGFLIAGALEKWQLHRRLALGIIRILGTSVQRLILGFMLATGFLSFFVTNTAAAMMMIPMGMALVAQVNTMKTEAETSDVKKFERALIFGVGYAATIAGTGTVLGGTSIPLFLAQAEIFAGVKVSFVQYIAFGIPFAFTFLILLWLYLTKIRYRMSFKTIPGGKEIVDKEHAALGRMSGEEKKIAFVGLFVSFLWISRPWLIDPFVADISDGMIAILGAVLLFVLPAKSQESPRVLVWEDTKKTPWGILIMLGGGLALAQAFSETGLSEWVGDQFLGLSGLPFLVTVLLIVTALVFMTEFTSTSATALLFVPLMGTLALSLGYDPLLVMLAATLAVNCAFMLPAATPPNSIMFGTGLVTIREMVRNGFFVSIMGIFWIVLFIWLWAPVVFS
ncbi:SLC13 family permease [Pseudoclavibacter sp. 8L]|uniref:SLC13 family permease n=1 Tax=Pseudoclavibacter sp. 8L TaxID=2653162 RepID=UPI0012F30BAD|nr:SLC13 family permease [Pseudoclavibacter sp. 8L]VXC06736.1 Sodium-dependent dicarboxylate transporter SdcS [Pseudoclavibacter sp. 8L]